MLNADISSICGFRLMTGALPLSTITSPSIECESITAPSLVSSELILPKSSLETDISKL